VDHDDSLPFDEFEPVYGEVLDNPLTAVASTIPERRDNRVHFDAIELHCGDFSRIEARICQIYRHESGTYHHTRVELLYFKRRRKADAFTVIRKAALDGEALETLLANLASIPRLKEIGEASQAILLPLQDKAAEITPDVLQGLARAVGVLLSTRRGLDAVGGGLLTPEVLDNIGAAAQHARFKRAAGELRQLIADPQHTEHIYQRWFEQHPWVFGTEYVRRIPARTIDLHSQADILLVSVDGFVDMFELKRPSHKPLTYDQSHDTYYPSSELSKALAQAMDYLRRVNERRLMLEEDWGEQVFRPRAIIVIGRSNEWGLSERQAWRTLKTSVQNIDLLTFDEVLGRAQQLITHYDTTGEPTVTEAVVIEEASPWDDMPF
jgi:hypothetical protein